MTTMELTILAALAAVILLLIVGLVLWQKHFTSQQDTLQDVAKILQEIDRTLKTFDIKQTLPGETVPDAETGQQEPVAEEPAEAAEPEQAEEGADETEEPGEGLTQQQEEGSEETGQQELPEAVDTEAAEKQDEADGSPEELEQIDESEATGEAGEQDAPAGEPEEPRMAEAVPEEVREGQEAKAEEPQEQKEEASADEVVLLTKKLAAELQELQELQRSQKELTGPEAGKEDEPEDEAEKPEDVSSAEETGMEAMESKDISQLLAAASEETKNAPAVSELDMGGRIRESAIYNVGKSGKAYTEEELEKLIRE